MTVDHDRWADSAGAYVLGAMPSEERAQFETHLATCPACREEVDDLRPAAEALPMASPPVLPPRALKDRIMTEVQREADLLAATPKPGGRARYRAPSWLSGWRLAPVAAVLIVAAVLAISALTGGGTTTYTAQVTAPGAHAQLHVSDDRGTLVGNLPAPPAGKVYEVWLMPEGSKTPEPTSVLFKPNADGSVEARIPGSLADVHQVLVTAEPPSGSATPTSDPVLSATLS